MILLHSRFALFKQALAFGAIRIIHVPELKKKYSFKKYQCFRKYFKWYDWVLQRKPYAWKTIAITNRFSLLMRCLAAQIRASVIKKNTRQANVNPCKDRDTSFGILLVYL